MCRRVSRTAIPEEAGLVASTVQPEYTADEKATIPNGR